MNQFLIIIRGAPASGKTTIAKKIRDFKNKIVWLKVDNFKDFFSNKVTKEEQKFVDECALATLDYLLSKGFSVVMEKIFYNSFIIPRAIEIANKRGVSTKVFQIICPLAVLQERDRTRPGIKEGCRKPLGDKAIERIYKHLIETFYPGAIKLDTHKLSLDDCVNLVSKSVLGYNSSGWKKIRT